MPFHLTLNITGYIISLLINRRRDFGAAGRQPDNRRPDVGAGGLSPTERPQREPDMCARSLTSSVAREKMTRIPESEGQSPLIVLNRAIALEARNLPGTWTATACPPKRPSGGGSSVAF